MKIMYMFLIVVFIQQVTSAPKNEPVDASELVLNFGQCPEFPSYFSLLYTTMTGQLDNISSIKVGPPTPIALFYTCLYKKFGIFNADKSINFDLYKNLMMGTAGIMGSSTEDLERYLSSTRHCYSAKGADEFETFGKVAECVNKIDFIVPE